MTGLTGSQQQVEPRRVLVRGGGDVGSAIAHRLFRHGCAVLIAELPQSAHARRGMAFTDALFDGHALLEGVAARWLPDVAAVLACWAQRQAVPVVTLAESELLATLHFDVLVDATMRRGSAPTDLRALAPLAIGLGPGYLPGGNCHIAIETQWGEELGRVLRDTPTMARSGGPRALDGVTRERFAIAANAGLWRTRAVLGQNVAAGEQVGDIDGCPIHAPLRGTLCGLSHDGATVVAGQRVVEVDPRLVPEVLGLGERPVAIARGVAEALGMDENCAATTRP